MKSLSSAFRTTVFMFSLLFFSGASHAVTVYSLIPELVENVSVTGTITTNGAIGILTSADILAYSISLNQLSNPDIPTETLASTTGAGFYILGNYLTATESAISWNFAQGVGAEASLYGSNTITQWHLYTNRIDVDFNGIEYAMYRDGVQPIALSNNVPEPTTVALLGLGLLGVAASRRKFAMSERT